MPNCRNNAMPYHNYRQMQAPTSMMRRESWNDMSLAMAYIPWQTWRDIYDAEKAFRRGTIFQELDKPFDCQGGMRR